MSPTPERGPRSGPEWITLAVATAVLATLVGLIVLQMTAAQDPAAPVVDVRQPIREVGRLHHVDVVLRNTGDETAAAVQVTAELVIDGETTSADQVIDYLAGDEEVDLVFVFADDPDEGDLRIEVAGFIAP